MLLTAVEAIIWSMIWTTIYLRCRIPQQVTFNYNSVVSKTAVQKDRFPSQFRGLQSRLGRGLEPPQAQAYSCSSFYMPLSNAFVDPIDILGLSVHLRYRHERLFCHLRTADMLWYCITNGCTCTCVWCFLCNSRASCL